MKSVRRSAPALFLPDEIILKILSKVSLKSLHRFKWVSKSWFSLITNEVLSQLVNSSNLTFYYTNYRYRSLKFESNIIQVLLDFLPKHNGNQCPVLTIVDWSGGLVVCRLLYRKWSVFHETSYYYVCNPVDKSYNRISTTGFDPYFFLLDFNPLISPHYKLIVAHLNGGLWFNVYHSENHFFEKFHVHSLPFLCVTSTRGHIALWNGTVYLNCQLMTKYAHGIGEEYRLMKISGVFGGSEKDIVCKFINFPEGSKYYTGMCNFMGTWRDRLRFVGVDDGEVRVWALWDSQEDEWTLEHICPRFLSSLERCPEDRPPCLVGLHPLQNAVLFSFKNSLFAYDLDQMLFEKFCELEHGDTFSRVFPFSPCFAKDVLGCTD